MTYRLRVNVRDPRYKDEVSNVEIEVESDDIVNIDAMIEKGWQLLSGLVTPQG